MLTTVTPDQLLIAAGDDLFARASVLGKRVTRGPWSADGAHLWGVTHHGEPGVIGIGNPASVAALLQAVRAEHPEIVIASLPRGSAEKLETEASVRDHWDWFAATDPAAPVAGEAGAGWLSSADDEIRALLTTASPETSTWPGDGRASRWAGIRTPSGTLVAVLADTSRHPSIAHVSSVATAPDHRRNGHGAALTAWAMRQFLSEGAAMVTLGMYAHNDSARAMYEALGFTCYHRFTSVSFNGNQPESPACTD